MKFSIFSFILVTFFIEYSQAAMFVPENRVNWAGSEIDWPCDSTKDMYSKYGQYKPKNIIATRSVIFRDDAIVVLPRFKSGVPITLGKISLKCKVGVPTLSAYPCWSIQEEGNCASLQNVVDIFLDPQDVLWVLDTGIVNYMEEIPIRRCTPKVLAFNLKNDKLVKVLDLSRLTTESSRLQYVVADYTQDGHLFVYVTDAAARAILVYDVTSNRKYRVILPEQVITIADAQDVLYPALIRQPDGSMNLIFTFLGDTRIFSIDTRYLQQDGVKGKIIDLGAKLNDMFFLGTDNGNSMFFRYEGKSDIYKWDASTDFCKENFIKISPGNDFMFATQVIPDYKRGRMRVLESNFPDFIRGTVGCGIEHSLSIL